MNDPRRFLPLIFILCFASAALSGQTSQQAYFEQNCSSCHTIGGGASVGPDLKNVPERVSRHWLVEFIRNPDAKIAAKDPRAAKIVTEAEGNVMPGFPDITEEFGEELLQYIDQQSSETAASTTTMVDGDAARGRELFLGQRRLSNNAAACVACHQASGLPLAGGRLGPNLTTAHQRLGGDRGLTTWLRNPPTPLMSSIFRPAPLTAEEALDLAAFLRATRENSSQLSETPLRLVQGIGVGGSLLMFVAAGTVWRRRLNSVRQHLLRKRGSQ